MFSYKTKEEIDAMNEEEKVNHAAEFIENIVKEQKTPEDKLNVRLQIDSFLSRWIKNKKNRNKNLKKL